MELTGWIKLWRKTTDNPSLKRRPNHLAVWIWLLTHVMWEDGVEVRFEGKIIKLSKGQITCGSNFIASETGVAPSTVRRIINDLVGEQLIEQQTDNRCSLITVKNWTQYQEREQQMSSKRAADEQLVSTKEEGKKVRKKEVSPTEIVTDVTPPDENVKEIKKGNESINMIINGIKETSGGMDGTEAKNRQMAWNLIKKIRKESNKPESTDMQCAEWAVQIMRLASKHQFWAGKITKVSDLFYNLQKIMNDLRTASGGNKPSVPSYNF